MEWEGTMTILRIGRSYQFQVVRMAEEDGETFVAFVGTKQECVQFVRRSQSQ